MKKLLLTFFVAGSLAQAFAQGLMVEPNESKKITFERSSNNQKVLSAWFNYGQTIYDQGGSVDYFRYHMFPDTTVMVEFSNGMGPVWVHGVGQVLDPYSAYWALSGNGGPLLNTEIYTVDSIRIWYRYFRYQNANPDTLHIQMYKHNAMTYNPTGWSNDGRSNARIAYDYTKNEGTGDFSEVKVLLTGNDTSMFYQNAIQLPTSNFTASAQQVVAVTAFYKNGNPTNLGDTLDPYMTPQPFNKRNTFLLYQFRDNAKTIDQGYYNHSQMLVNTVRYNINQNGWNGQFIPGLAFNSGFYHLDMDYKITSSVGVTENEAFGIKTSVYPNPVEKGFANVRINLEKQENIEVALFDITGKVVKIFSNETLNAGTHIKGIDLTGVNAGVYFVKVKYENKTQVIKINVL